MSRYVLGIDGGGTKTAFALVDIQNKRIFRHDGSDMCHFHHGVEGFQKRLKAGLSGLYKKAKAKSDEVVAVCAGISSYGEGQQDSLIKSIIQSEFKTQNVAVVNDAEVALAGSLALKPGINIVAGTGSMAFGKDIYGNSARSGGWGEIIGDEGSGYWLGKKAMELFAKQSDGRIKKGALYSCFKEEFSLEKDLDFIEYVYRNIKSRREIAGLQLLLYKAAQLGDDSAIDAFTKAAEELYELIENVAQKLSFEDDLLISYSGGVFKAKDYLLSPLKSLVKSRLKARLTLPKLSPISGAVLIAADIAGVSEEIADELIRFEQAK